MTHTHELTPAELAEAMRLGLNLAEATTLLRAMREVEEEETARAQVRAELEQRLGLGGEAEQIEQDWPE